MADLVKWSKDYKKDFDSEWYLQYLVGNNAEEIDDSMGYMQFLLNNLHEFFSKGDIKGERLLDVGTGPSVHTLISAADNVQEVYLSDYTTANRNILNEWLTGERDLVPAVFKYLIKKDKSDQTVEQRQRKLREKVKGIFPIDITIDQPLGKETPSCGYDIITSSTCLESASHTIDDYKKCAKHLTALLKPGGYLALCGVLNDSFYTVNTFKFPCAKISKEQLKSIYTNLGYHVIRFETLAAAEDNDKTFCDYEGQFVMLAKKN